jgi:hypothetical protein
MGVGHLDIGENLGGAQLFGPNPAIAQFGQILAQRKAKQDADNKYLADTLAQAKPDGLRNDADRTNFFNKYQKLKDEGIAAENEPDKLKKAMALANVRQGVMDLNSYVDQSKKQAVNERAWAQAYQTAPHNWSPSAIEGYRKSINAAIGSPDVITDFTTQERLVDPDKIDKMYQEHKDLLTKNLQYDNGTLTPGVEAGIKGNYKVQTRGIPIDGADGALANTMHWATAHDDVIKSLQDRYPQIQGKSPQETIGLRTKQYMIDRGDKDGIYDTTRPVFEKEREPDRFYEHEQWLIDHGLKTADGALTPAQSLITGMQKGQTGSGEKLLSLLPKDQYGGHKPYIHQDQAGNHIFMFPAQVDQKAVEYNQAMQKKWAKENPGEPFDPTDKDYKLKQTVIKPGKTYTLNPTSNTYVADAAQMATEQNINLTHLNQAESKKGGRGQIPEAANGLQQKQKPSKTPKTVSSAADYDALQSGETYIAPNGKLYTKK